MASRQDDTIAELQRTVAELRRERDEHATERDVALAQKAALAEVLDVINRSPGDPGPVFDLILDKAHALCHTDIGSLGVYDGTHFRKLALRGYSQDVEAVLRQPYPPLTSHDPLFRRETIHIQNVAEYAFKPDVIPAISPLIESGLRAWLEVPLWSNGKLVGSVSGWRHEARAFSEQEISLLENFAAQAVIAMENARLITETREALERQTATAEVLQVINANPGNLAPVFDAILERAMRLCGAAFGMLRRFDGTRVHMTASRGLPEAFAAFSARNPAIPTPGTSMGRALSSGRPDQLLDIRQQEDYETSRGMRAIAELGGARTVLTVPLVKDGFSIALFTFYRTELRGFSDKEIALLENFAAQAVIAMENARLLMETREALEQQTAVAEVLQVINANPGDLTPVFQTMLDRAVALCGADLGETGTYDGDAWTPRAVTNVPPEFARIRVNVQQTPGPGTFHEHWRRGGNVYHLPDLRETEAYRNGEPLRRALVDVGGARALLGVALRRDDALAGIMSIMRREPGPFSDRQIALLENFAAQAVIAMENARLLMETREALERQTATAEVLQVINANPGDVVPVFDAILANAHRVCGASIGSLWLYDGELIHAAATRGMTEAAAAQMRQPRPPSIAQERLIRERSRYYHSAEHRTDDAENNPEIAASGAQTIMGVPLVKDGRVIGIISARRLETRPFSEREIELLENFAAQAVIAMENARLLTETREGLEQQTATAEVLRVINESPGDLTPVFDAILNKAHTLCGAAIGSLYTWDGKSVRAVATHGFPEDYAAFARQNHPPNFMIRPLIDGERYHHVPDVRALEPTGDKHASSIMEQTDARTILMIPLRKDGTFGGFITAVRTEVRPFVEKEIALLENFAAQAVIAMENARLLTETQEALEQQTATAEVLGVINRNPGDLAPVFDGVLERALRLCGAYGGGVFTVRDMRLKYFAFRGMPDAFARHRLNNELPVSTDAPPHRMMLSGRTVTVVDTATDSWFVARPQRQREATELGGARSVLNVPFIKDGSAVGGIALFRETPGDWPDRQVALLENFAAQAVIAMENARLLTETQEALEQQTATAEVLQVINASPGDLAPVFDAMLEKAMRLCSVAFGSFHTWDGEATRFVAMRGFPPEIEAYVAARGPSRAPGPWVRTLAETRRPYQYDDFRTTEAYLSGHPDARTFADLGGVRTGLLVPLVKDLTLIGYVAVYRLEVRPFTDKEIALLENFAAQAVIAIENARLLTEQREALEQQTATAEVLQVINANPGDLQPVFDAILERAHRICKVSIGNLGLYDGRQFRARSMIGYGPATEAFLRAGWDRNPVHDPLLRGEVMHLRDRERHAWTRETEVNLAYLREAGINTTLMVPLFKDGSLLGYISASRSEVAPFSDREIALLESFAAQAVIAMDNARLLNEIRQRQSELDITFENMGDGVAMFDRDHRLAAWNRNFQNILDLPDDTVRVGLLFADYLRSLADKGEYGPNANADQQIANLTAGLGQPTRFERTRPNGHVIDIRQNPIPGGGFVVIYADITERKRAEEALRAARDAAETALRDLKIAQANLVQAEKMASLGQLTAGIAHEIKNPLNFVNNFASLSVDLLAELKQAAEPGFAALTEDQRAEIDEVSDMLTGNLRKITEHGKRADGIVKAMLEHSRGASAERRTVDINALADEALNLAYHGARAQDQSFNITLEHDFGDAIAPIEVNPQDVTRVLLNLFSNGFYAANKRAQSDADGAFRPTLKLTTRAAGDAVEIRVRDNGTGIPQDIRDKLFQPFFTTKPTGEGTGLGLSITYDIVTKAHGGTISVDSEVDEFTEFVVTLPRRMFASGGSPGVT